MGFESNEASDFSGSEQKNTGNIFLGKEESKLETSRCTYPKNRPFAPNGKESSTPIIHFQGLLGGSSQDRRKWLGSPPIYKPWKSHLEGFQSNPILRGLMTYISTMVMKHLHPLGWSFNSLLVLGRVTTPTTWRPQGRLITSHQVGGPQATPKGSRKSWSQIFAMGIMVQPYSTNSFWGIEVGSEPSKLKNVFPASKICQVSWVSHSLNLRRAQFQWIFQVPLKGGRWHIIPQLAVYTVYTTYIPLIYCLLGGYILPTTF